MSTNVENQENQPVGTESRKRKLFEGDRSELQDDLRSSKKQKLAEDNNTTTISPLRDVSNSQPEEKQAQVAAEKPSLQDVEMKEKEVLEEIPEVSDNEEEDEEDVVEDNIPEEEDETFGLQSEESNEPLQFEQEAKEAEEMAKQLGLSSTEEATSRVGKNKVVDNWLAKYLNIVQSGVELDKALTQGIRSLSEVALGKKGEVASPGAIDFCKAVLAKFVEVISRMAATHADYRKSKQIVIQDVLESFKVLGRPVYWNSEVIQIESKPDQTPQKGEEKIEGETKTEQPEDTTPVNEESDSEGEPEPIPQEPDQEADNVDEEKSCLDSSFFNKLIGFSLGDNAEYLFDPEASQVIQASTEEYLVTVLEHASQLSKYTKKEKIEESDIKFILAMWNSIPGGNELIKRMRFPSQI